MAEVAAEKGASIICYPELCLSHWFLNEENKSSFSLALTSLSGTLSRFQQVSERTKTVLVVPFFESVNGTYYNSAAVYDSGKLLGTYRKIHLPDLPLYREQFYFSPGNTGSAGVRDVSGQDRHPDLLGQLVPRRQPRTCAQRSGASYSLPRPRL